MMIGNFWVAGSAQKRRQNLESTQARQVQIQEDDARPLAPRQSQPLLSALRLHYLKGMSASIPRSR